MYTASFGRLVSGVATCQQFARVKGRSRRLHSLLAGLLTAVFLTLPQTAFAQEAYRTPQFLKKLSLEELTDIEVTSASRRPELLSHAATAIDVVTAEEIRRAGVFNIPDALRLAAAIHVAQISGTSWAISTRGFNTTTTNKLQVLLSSTLGS